MSSFKEFCKIFQDFCQSTSLHGYGYLYNAKSIVEKLIWIIAIISMTSIGALLLVDNTQVFLNSTLSSTQSLSDLNVVSVTSIIQTGIFF